MKTAPLALLVLLVAAISCKKSSSPAPESLKYMSLTTGNTWNYQTTNNLTAAITANTVTSTSRDTAIGSKTYHVFTNSNGNVNDYYNITGNDYYTFRNLVALGSSSVESIYLKDNAAVGVNWAQTINVAVPGLPTTIPVVLTQTVAEKDITRTVNSKIYNNVIHTTTTITAASLPAGSLTTDIQSYYAPNYGLIESKNKITITLVAGSNVDQVTILKSASF